MKKGWERKISELFPCRDTTEGDWGLSLPDISNLLTLSECNYKLPVDLPWYLPHDCSFPDGSTAIRCNSAEIAENRFLNSMLQRLIESLETKIWFYIYLNINCILGLLYSQFILCGSRNHRPDVKAGSNW